MFRNTEIIGKGSLGWIYLVKENISGEVIKYPGLLWFIYNVNILFLGKDFAKMMEKEEVLKIFEAQHPGRQTSPSSSATSPTSKPGWSCAWWWSTWREPDLYQGKVWEVGSTWARSTSSCKIFCWTRYWTFDDENFYKWICRNNFLFKNFYYDKGYRLKLKYISYFSHWNSWFSSINYSSKNQRLGIILME